MIGSSTNKNPDKAPKYADTEEYRPILTEKLAVDEDQSMQENDEDDKDNKFL